MVDGIDDRTDGEEINAGKLLDAIEKTWITEESVVARGPWDALVLVVSFGEGHVSMNGACYDGIVRRSCTPLRGSQLVSFDAFRHLRSLTPNDEGALWTTVVLIYNAMTGEFSHHFAYGDEHPEWNIDTPGEADRALELLNPLKGVQFEQPVSSRGAMSLVARYHRPRKEPTSIRVGNFRTDRLSGGWRLYAPVSVDQGSPLAAIEDATEGMVFLVKDSGAVTHTFAPVGEHQGLLDALS